MSGCTDASTLADLKIVPIGLVTMFDLRHCDQLTGNRLSRRFPENPKKDHRLFKTFSQSEGGTVVSNYHRLTRGGLPIQDNGFCISQLNGSVEFRQLKLILPDFNATTLVWINENQNRPNFPPIWKKKLEFRQWEAVDPKRPGALDVKATFEALGWIPDDALVDVVVWLNPNKSTSWWQMNVVCRCWDQRANLNVPRSPLEVCQVEGRWTVGLEQYGFEF